METETLFHAKAKEDLGECTERDSAAEQQHERSND